MEPQYVASEHPWFKAGAPFVVPNSGIYGMRQVPIYTGARIGLDTFNLMRAENAAEIRKAFAFWAAPQGRVSDGVDGFRIDHMMDDLDNRHVNTNLLAGFWSPLEAELRRLKPGLFFVAEQSDWKSLGDSLFSSGGVDSVYAIPLRSAFIDAVAKQNGAELAVALDQEQSVTPPEKTQLTVIEDHDVLRWASAIHADPTLLRLAAAFQFAIQGTPSIYYGQELGMHGLQLKGRSDANDIPIRLAMPWETSPDAPGTATWYGPGPWLEAPESKLNAGISVAQEDADPGSLLNFYRKLIKIRRSSPALTIGDQKLLPTDNPHVLALSRSAGRQRIVALFNFSDQAQNVMIADHKSGRDLLTGQSQRLATTLLPSHGFQWIDLR
jgi:glycosidase